MRLAALPLLLAPLLLSPLAMAAAPERLHRGQP